MATRRDAARDFDLEPVRAGRVRETTAPPPPGSRSLARDLGISEDELVPVGKLRERDAIVSRWGALAHAQVTAETTADFIGSLGDLARLGRPA
jgi:hypothetical protein